MKAVNLVRMGLVVGGFTGGGACSIDGGIGSGAEDVTVISSATSGEMNARKRINARSLMVPCCIRVGLGVPWFGRVMSGGAVRVCEATD